MAGLLYLLRDKIGYYFFKNSGTRRFVVQHVKLLLGRGKNDRDHSLEKTVIILTVRPLLKVTLVTVNNSLRVRIYSSIYS
jgi:hypothetical protein